MTTSALSVQASGETGAICQVSGPYQSTRNAKLVTFVKAGDEFPADADGASTTWVILRVNHR